jgi:pentatricopeptide repeat protein
MFPRQGNIVHRERRGWLAGQDFPVYAPQARERLPSNVGSAQKVCPEKHMTQLTAPSNVSQNVARAKSLIHRNEVLRAMNCLISALENYSPHSVVGQARYKLEINIRQCVGDINLHPKVHKLLTELTKSSSPQIPYTPGEEGKLLTVLNVLRKALEKMDEVEQQNAQQALEQRKVELFEAGERLLGEGERVKGKVELRKLATEFGKEPGILERIAGALIKADMAPDAVEFLEMAIENFSKEGQLYRTLIDCYMTMREYEKAEAVYLKVLSQFGANPRTMASLAQLYKLQNKRPKAVEMAQRVLGMEPDNADALEIVRTIRF